MLMAGKRDVAQGQPRTQQEIELWAALAANAEFLGSSSPDKRMSLLRERARLWDELATISSPACGQAYRDAAAKCRAEAEQLS